MILGSRTQSVEQLSQAKTANSSAVLGVDMESPKYLEGEDKEIECSEISYRSL
jgi:hypothetical protein